MVKLLMAKEVSSPKSPLTMVGLGHDRHGQLHDDDLLGQLGQRDQPSQQNGYRRHPQEPAQKHQHDIPVGLESFQTDPSHDDARINKGQRSDHISHVADRRHGEFR